jgi:hypothetical protein
MLHKICDGKKDDCCLQASHKLLYCNRKVESACLNCNRKSDSDMFLRINMYLGNCGILLFCPRFLQQQQQFKSFIPSKLR